MLTLLVSRLMAISIQFDRMLRSGEAKDTLHLAEMHSICSPRVTQIMNLSLLAPEIQETLLCLPHEFVGQTNRYELSASGGPLCDGQTNLNPPVRQHTIERIEIVADRSETRQQLAT